MCCVQDSLTVEKSLRMRYSFRSDTSFERLSAARTYTHTQREGEREGRRERVSHILYSIDGSTDWLTMLEALTSISFST